MRPTSFSCPQNPRAISPRPSSPRETVSTCASIARPIPPTMTGEKVVNTYLDLFTPPKFEAKFTGVRKVTIGDLHGNPLSLVHYLVKVGVLECNCNLPDFTEKYAQFKRIVYLSSLDTDEQINQRDIDIFKILLQELFPIKNKEIFFRLIGDIVSERISDCNLMMLVLEHLHDAGVPYKINFSNHDSFFVAQFYFKMDVHNPKNEISRIMEHKEYSSLKRLKLLFQKGIFNSESFVALSQKVHMEHLELLSYEKKGNGRYCIFSHAILLNKFINSFILKYADEMIETGHHIRDTDPIETQIEKINSVFLHMLKQQNKKLLHDFLALSEHDGVLQKISYPPLATIEDIPTYWIIWARGDLLTRQQGRSISMPTLMDEPGLITNLTDVIHGHTPEKVLGCQGKTYTTLDGQAGKTIKQFEQSSSPRIFDLAFLFCQFGQIS